MVADFNKKQKGEAVVNKLLFKAFGIIFLFVILILIIADLRIYQKKKDLVSQIDFYKKQIEEIKKNGERLKNQIDNSDSKNFLNSWGGCLSGILGWLKSKF